MSNNLGGTQRLCSIMETRQLRIKLLAVAEEEPPGGARDPEEWRLLEELFDRRPFMVAARETCQPQQALLRARLRIWSEPDSGAADVILTTGGTGLAPKDRMPEATAEVIERALPGIPDLIRLACLRTEPGVALHRLEAGVRQQTLIINLPASTALLERCLGHVARILPAAVAELHP